MGEPFSNSRQIIRKAFLEKGVPEEAVAVTMASLSNATLKQYSGTIWRWYEYCKAKEILMFKPTITNVISFLNSLVTNKTTYNTINAHRAALNLIIHKNYDHEELVKRYLKGIFKLRPNFPRYQSTWDPAVVLRYLEPFYPLETLKLETLTKKLLGLLALTTAHRVHTISKIRVKKISKNSCGFEILITDIIKTSDPKRPQPLIKLNFFKKNPKLCVASTLLEYLKRTADYRENQGDDFLFLTVKPPHKTATTQTLSRWLKSILKDSGVDTNIFKSHSTRHASTSAASRAGVSVDQIMKTAGWTKKSSCFAKFYCRPLHNDGNEVATALLKNAKM